MGCDGRRKITNGFKMCFLVIPAVKNMFLVRWMIFVFSNYNEQQFAMILSIYPESYNIRCERRWMPIGGRHCNLKEYEYVIEPNLVNGVVIFFLNFGI